MSKRVYVSRWRVVYEPKGKPAVTLLDVGDLSDAEPAFEGGPEAQVDALLKQAWAGHWSRGAVRMRLVCDAYHAEASPWAAQRAGLEHWRAMQEAPEGVLVVETAFAGQSVGTPGVSWRMKATLNTARYVEQDAGSSPYEGGGSWQMRYDFNVSPEEEA